MRSSTVVARTRAELSDALDGRTDPDGGLGRARGTGTGGGAIGVVMTMGALHAGHAELVRQARKHADVVVVTVFLNPLQFGPGEDLAKYPQTLEADLRLCREEGVDLVFAPAPDVVYPGGEPQVRVAAGRLGARLEGAFRPGHFDGVLTVVAKLLHLTRADLAFFGQKDAQQLLMIRAMVEDLDFACRVVAVPTVRDPDGLALSSRNTYLSSYDRQAALALSRALTAGRDAAPGGPSAVRRAAREIMVAEPLAQVEYLVLVHPQTLDDVAEWYRGDALLLVAARIGRTRLIDNVTVTLGEPA